MISNNNNNNKKFPAVRASDEHEFGQPPVDLTPQSQSTIALWGGVSPISADADSATTMSKTKDR